MTNPGHRSETIDQHIVVTEHLHQRMLNRLAGASLGEKRRTSIGPRPRDPIAPRHRVGVARFGVSLKVDSHQKDTEPRLSSSEARGPM